MKRVQAKHYRQMSDGAALCCLCPRLCRIHEGERGRCGVRLYQEGVLYAAGYGQMAAIHTDPIEKKPLFHFLPGTKTYSIGGWGCNLNCPFCQNHSITMHKPSQIVQMSPAEVVKAVRRLGCPSLSFTYNEPSIHFEFVWETAKLAKSQGIKVVLVTNGYIMPAPLKELLPLIDAMNIDVKTFHQQRYFDLLGGKRDDVLNTVKIAKEYCHIEITTLIVPGISDDLEEGRQFFRWLGGISPQIPLHLNRYYPAYHYTHPPTDIGVMEKMQAQAEKYLQSVYLGNLP